MLIDIKKVPFPDTLAARMYSLDHCVSAAPLATLANTGILNIPIAMIALKAPGPKIAVIKIAIINAGKAKIKSLNLITKSSKKVPLFAAAIIPKGNPKNIPIPTATKATAIEVCAPTMIIESISLPK